MKTLILYSSNTGTSAEVAKLIQNKIKNCDIQKITNEFSGINLKPYDTIIFGSGIYFGKTHKFLRKFIKKHYPEFKDKNFGAYFCCAQTNLKTRTKYKNKNYKLLSQNAIAISPVGGKINLKQSKGIKKLIKLIMHKFYRIKSKPLPQLDHEEINNFAEKMVKIPAI